MNRPIFLWCIPRSASTAFERVFVERDDALALHEPYSMAFYHGRERRHGRYASTEADPAYDYAAVTAQIFDRDHDKIVFVKDMAYHVRDFWTPDFLRRVRSTFLLRQPVSALASLYKMVPDFDLEETGYPELEKVFEATARLENATPVLIRTEDFQAAPDATMSAYCDRLGIPFVPSAMRWERKDVQAWNGWKRWHVEALASEKINAAKPPPDLNGQPDHVKRMVAKVRPIYENLVRHRLRP